MIFGSHNSATYGELQGCCVGITSPWTQNQNLTIKRQLDRGVRWFDLRVSYCPIDGEIYISHTVVTNNTLGSVFNAFEQFLAHDPRGELLIVHLRVDFEDRDNILLIQPRVNGLIDYYNMNFLERSHVIAPLETMRSQKKIILYCADGSLQHHLICSTDLMPTIYLWDAGSIDECERRLEQMKEELQKQENGPFLFSKNWMVNFDYSSYMPLWFTNWQQTRLMERYKKELLGADIIAGNNVQKIMKLFRSVETVDVTTEPVQEPIQEPVQEPPQV